MKTIVHFNQLPVECCGRAEKLLRELDGFISREGDVAEIFVKKYGRYSKRVATLDTSTGYMKLSFYSKTAKKVFTIKEHRLLALAFLPNPNHHKIINHKDSNKQNNSISNLEWCSSSFNTIHAIENRAYSHLLCKEQVIEIYRRIHENKETVQDLAAEYNLCTHVIGHIRNQKTYSYFTNSIQLSDTNYVKRLSEQEIKEIFHLSNNRFWTLREIADIYNIHFTLVSKIKNGRRYADITHAA
jgi:hypothetical protein